MDIKNAILVQNPEVTFRKVGPSYLLNHQGKVYEMNRTGADVWQMLSKPASLCEIVKLIVSQYNIEPETIKTDLKQWLSELVGLGMVTSTTQDRPAIEDC